MITIHKSYIEQEEGWTKLVTDVDLDGEKKQVWASVEKRYGKYLCYERADAMLIGLLPYALRHKHDIACEAPVTDQLLYNINEILLPALLRNDIENHSVKIHCEIKECAWGGGKFPEKGGRNRFVMRCGQLSCCSKTL